MGEIIDHPAKAALSRRVQHVEAVHIGQRRPHRLPKLWQDVEVRRVAIDCYGETTLDGAVARLRDAFGGDRCPSRSALQRFWAWLDRMFPER